jgi:hypothetical protein
MAWQAVVRGANGIVFYSFFDLLRNDDMPFAQVGFSLFFLRFSIENAEIAPCFVHFTKK